MAKKLKPVHPGEILREEFMKPLVLGMNKLALDLRVPVRGSPRSRPILRQLEIPLCGFHAFRHVHASLLLEIDASPKVARTQLSARTCG